MTPEQLLRPRYLVIAEDTSNHNWKIRDIYSIDGNNAYNETQGFGIAPFPAPFFDKYPHLFRRLEWWEMRDEKDMPEYVKLKDERTRQVRKYEANFTVIIFNAIDEGEWDMCYCADCVPSTETEYQTYLNTLQ